MQTEKFKSGRKALAFIAMGFVLGTATHAGAQAWPSKPIRLLVGQAAGGLSDQIGRSLGDAMSASLGQPILLENRPGGGAGGILATTLVSEAPPDGYTLGLGTSGPFGAGAVVNKVPWDPINGFSHISLISEAPLLLVSSSALPANTLTDVIKLIRANPGKYNYGSDGVGSTAHLALESLKLREKLFIVHIPYVTTVSRLQALLVSDVHFMLYNATAQTEALAKEGKLRILAVANPTRLSQFPSVPTTSEAGLPGFTAGSWFFVFGPRGLPRDILLRLNKEVATALQRPDVQKRIVAAGQLVVRSSTPEEMTAFIAAQNKQWKEVVEKTGIKAE
jgi:tripartite-type tricarboxylate transporter receptor subunit TctC